LQLDPPALSAFPTRRSSDLWNSQASLEASSVASAGSSTILSTWLSRNDVRSRIAENTGSSAASAVVRISVYPFSGAPVRARTSRSEEHTSELQSRFDLACRL